jgi:hypothetical protein
VIRIKQRAMLDRLTQLQDTVKGALREADDLWVRSPRGSTEALALSDVGIGLERAAAAMAQIARFDTVTTVVSYEEQELIEATEALTQIPLQQES